MTQAYLVDAVRTPIGKFGGALSTVRADTLASLPIRALLERNPALAGASIEEVILGCANQSGEDNRNIARMALLLAGLPVTVAGETINRLCASGLSAVVAASRAIASGEGEIFIAGGIEHMTRSPYVIAKANQAFDRNLQLFDTTIGWRFVNPEFESAWGVDSMGETAENLYEQFGVSREDQDRFAFRSQEKAARARRENRFGQEIIPVHVSGPKGASVAFTQDETPRENTSLEALAMLKPAFRTNGSVTAGNASGICDGACALLVASESAVKRLGLKPYARLVSSAAVGVEPRVMGLGPIEAVKKALSRAKLKLDQIDLIEINEAFAVQVLTCLRELGIADDDPRVNPNGGAIALGHPLGMSGARLCATAMYELAVRKKTYALVTMCVGVGQGFAAILERTSE